MNIKSMVNNKVVKAGSWYTITEFFLKGITFLTIPIFTRLLTPSDYGIASLYATWVGIFTIIIGLNLNVSIMKGKYDFKENYNNFVSSVMFLSVLILVGYIIVFLAFGDVIRNLTGLSKSLFGFMVVQAYFTFVINSIIVKFRVEYNYKLVSIISIVVNILGVLLSIYLILYSLQELPYLGKILGSGILVIIQGFVFLIYIIIPGRGKLWNFNYWKYALILSMPLIIHSLSGIVNAQFDRIIINRYMGESATGIYSFAYNVGMIITVLTHALDQAWSPWTYEMMNEGNFAKIKSRGKIYRNFFAIAYAGLLFFSPEIVKVMADERYWEALNIVPYIFAGYYFSYLYTLEVKTEFFYGKTSLVSVGTVLSAIINIVLNIIFVPIYGYMAAAVATTISYLFLFIFHYLITSRVIKLSIYGFKFHLISIVYMLAITMYYIVFREMIFIRMVGILIIIILAFQYFKK